LPFQAARGRDAAIFARRPPKTSAHRLLQRRRRVSAERRVRSCPSVALSGLWVSCVERSSGRGMSDRRPPSSRDHQRRHHARPHTHRSSSSTPDPTSRRREERRCPPPLSASGKAEQHASASEPSSAFDVNSFLQKTLSNFRLDQTELTAPPADGLDAAKKSAKRQPSKLSRQSSTSDAAPLLAPSMPIIAVATQDVALRTPSVKQTMTPSLSKGSLISLASSSRPLCRICHLQNDTPSDPLIWPCRCSGTMQFVHTSCLVVSTFRHFFPISSHTSSLYLQHWLEISTKKMCPAPRCELCGYYYKTHHCLNVNRIACAACDSVYTFSCSACTCLT
jgi:hypothetical protein